MPLTLKPVLKAQAKADGTHLVLLRITVDRVTRYAGLGIYVRKKDYNPKSSLDKVNWIRSSHDLHEVYNSRIKQKIKVIFKQVAEAEKKGAVITADLVQELVKGKGGGSFLDFYQAYIAPYNNDLQHRLYEKYVNVYNKLVDYLKFKKKKDLPYSELNLKLLQGFEKWLLTDYRPKDGQGNVRVNAKPNKRNTVSKTLSFIKTVTRAAVKAGEMAHADNPFLNFELQTEKTHKDRLTKEELTLFTRQDIKPRINAWHARNVFLMQFYCAGTRVGDILQLKWQNIANGRVTFRMEKTDLMHSMELPEQALKILAHYSGQPTDYIFPFIPNEVKLTKKELEKKVESATAQINDKLKEQFAKLGIEKKISTHVARHSFADLARQSGSTVYDISKSLGHTSLKMTENYLASFDSSAVDKVLKNMFGEGK